MNREHVMSVLYDITMVIGGETRVAPLLTKTLQRLLYHTSFPLGLVFTDSSAAGPDGNVQVRLDAAIGDYLLSGYVGKRLDLPAALIVGPPEIIEDSELLAALPSASRDYAVFLRLPIDQQGVILLVAPHRPHTDLPLTNIFQPVLANLAKAIMLCRHNEMYTNSLLEERDHARQALVESEEKFRSISSAAQDAIIMLDDEGRVVYWNPSAERMFDYSAEEIRGKEVHSIIVPQRYFSAFQSGFSQFKHTGGGPIVGTTTEMEALNKDQQEFPVELSVSSLQLNGRWHAVGIMRDITARKKAEVAIAKANRALRTLSACNEVLIRVTEESHLLNEICRVVVELGGYRMAWVGYVEHDAESSVKPVAVAGQDDGYVAGLDIRWSDSGRGNGPTGLAIRTGQPRYVQDIAGDPAYALWRTAALQRGYASSLALPLMDADTVFGVIHVYAHERDAFNDDELALLRELSEDLSFGIRVLRLRKEREQLEEQQHRSALRLQQALIGTIQAVSLTVEKRDPYTAGHQQNVARLAMAIAGELGWPAERIEGLRLGAMIHDIGKIYVPSEILNRPGTLTDSEFRIIKSHPQVGYEIIKDVAFPWPVAEMIVQHHERLDGSGYPHGLRGEEMTAEAKVLAVADVVEAMASHRPYRAALGITAALDEIRANRGRLYETKAADACIRLFEQGRFSF